MLDELNDSVMSESSAEVVEVKIGSSTTSNSVEPPVSPIVQDSSINLDPTIPIDSSSESFQEKKKETHSERYIPIKNDKGFKDLLSTPEQPSGNSSDKKLPRAETRSEGGNTRPFKYLSTENLRTREQLIHKRTSEHLKKLSDLDSEISEINEKLTMMPYGENYRKQKREIRFKETEITGIEGEIKKLGEELEYISDEREQRKIIGKEDRDSLEIQVETIYRQGDLADDIITNVVLYAAIYFSGLPINDFKEVIDCLLNGVYGRIENKLRPQSKSDDDELISEFISVNLQAYWKDNLLQSDRFLEACNLEAKYYDGLFIVDFTSAHIRESISQYFEKNKPSFRNEQLNRVEYLLFHKSQRVSSKAAQLLAESAQEKNSGWLLEIVNKIDDFEYGFDRIAQLMYEIQFRLVPKDSGNILLPFFRLLLKEIDAEATVVNAEPAIDMIILLLYKHLQSGLAFNMQKAVPQLLDWLREIIDEIDLNKSQYTKDHIKWLLSQSDTSSYLYDFLEILYDWLPKEELENEEDYKISHNLAIGFLSQYCKEMLDNVRIEDYGKWTSTYVLFKPLCYEENRLSKLDMLIKWLFYLDKKKSSKDNNSDLIPHDFFVTGFVISEWFSILYGLKKDGEVKPQASELARDILKQIIEVTDRGTQRRLTQCWSELTDKCLDIAERYDQEENIQMRKQFSVRRIRIRELKKLFKQLQQEVQREEAN